MNIALESSKACQIEKLLGIATEVFGDGYVKSIEIENTITITLDNEIAGFGYYYLSDSFEGILKMFAISKEYQGKGLGSRLLIEMENRLISMGAKKLIVPAWRDCNGINIEKLLNKFGYRKNLEVFDYWRKDCDKGCFKCPSRTNKCNCSAVFFIK